ncbi:MAG: ferrous iron transporter B [Bdellovibrionales bacterium]|nr:ferrous iron transporter B [Bdellovibrionales bacterium]
MSVDQLTPAVALVGSPNSGKTTLFNWLTGSKFKTVNYAGSTVDAHRGLSLPLYGERLTLLDTPGIYSLQPHGEDEEVTLRTLTQGDQVRAAIVVLDGTQLNRQLYLVRQMQELAIPMVLAVTMMDLVKGAGRRLDLEKLSELTDCPVVAVDGRLGGGVQDVVDAARVLSVARPSRTVNKIAWDDARIEREVAVAEAWTKQVVYKAPDKSSLDHLRRWDRFLLHSFWGAVFFVLIMGMLFSSIFWLAAPMMDLVDLAFGTAVQAVLDTLGTGLLGDFVGNGIVSGVGAVMVFVPQIFILFVGFTLLEDSGYLARAATIVDRPLHKLGLSGRAFVPILSGFACAVPAIMATRNIRSARERWITVFIIPFMTCSARLPVYALLLTFIFHDEPAWKPGLALTALYLGALVIGGIAAAILNRMIKATHESHFLMELPVYRWPKPKFTLQIALRRTRSYVMRAGPTIFVFVMILWAGTHIPFIPDATPTQQLEESVVGKTGQLVEPVFAPMGLDWRAGLGIMSAFVAREVFVSSLAVIFSIADTDDDSLQDSLLQRMHEATLSNGSPMFTTASVVGLILFFMIALQCLSTTGVTWREMGSWKYAIGQLVALNILAYVVAVIAVQSLRAAGIA